MKKHIFLFLLVMAILFANVDKVCASNGVVKTKTNDKVIFIQSRNGKFDYSWSFDKKDFNKKDFDFDMKISFQNDKLYDLDKLLGNKNKKKLISFNYHGVLPGKATIKVSVQDSFKDGDVLSLYYYDEDEEKVELVEKRIKVINGHITFDIEHCSSYFVTASIVNDPSKTSDNGTIIIAMIIVIVGLVGYTIFKNKK